MRLIDADGVIEEIKKNKLLAREPATERCMEIIKNAATYIETPSYDVDKVVEQIEKIMEDESIRFADQVVRKAIKIVKAGVIRPVKIFKNKKGVLQCRQ